MMITLLICSSCAWCPMLFLPQSIEAIRVQVTHISACFWTCSWSFFEPARPYSLTLLLRTPIELKITLVWRCARRRVVEFSSCNSAKPPKGTQRLLQRTSNSHFSYQRSGSIEKYKKLIILKPTEKTPELAGK